MNLKELKELIDLVTEKGFTELEIERQGFRLRMSKAGTQPQRLEQVLPIAPMIATPVAAVAPQIQPAETPQPAPGASPAAPKTDAKELKVIKSVMVGTFYRSPSPTSEPFVNVGDRVEPETVVCIIEAMKLMNPIQADIRGEIVEVYVENGQPVEYGQPLFGLA